MKEKTKKEVDYFIKKITSQVGKTKSKHGNQTVGNHTFGLLFLILVFCPDSLNRKKCLKMALVHDLKDVLCKDEGIGDIAEGLGLPEIASYYHKYYAKDSDEARFVNDMHSLELVFSAYYGFLYEKKYLNKIWKKFYLVDAIDNVSLLAAYQTEYINIIISELTSYKKLVILLGKAKKVKRNGYCMREPFYEDVFETDGDHTVTTMLLNWFLFGDVNEKIVAHDVAEYDKGDYTPMHFEQGIITRETRRENEDKCMKYLIRLSKHPFVSIDLRKMSRNHKDFAFYADFRTYGDLAELMEEYEENITVSANQAKACDRLDFMLKTLSFALQGKYPLLQVKSIIKSYREDSEIKIDEIWDIVEYCENRYIDI